MIDQSTIPGLAESQAELAAAQAARSAIEQQHSAANDAVRAAHTKRSALVKRIAAGEAANLQEIIAADNEISEAEAHAAMLRDALAQTDEAGRRASEKIRQLNRSHGAELFVQYAENKLALLARADKIAGQIKELAQEVMHNNADLHEAMLLAEINSPEISAGIGDHKGYAIFLPERLHRSIIRTESNADHGLSEVTRQVWGRHIAAAKRRIGDA